MNNHYKPAFRKMVKRLKKYFIFPAVCPDLTNPHANVGIKMKTFLPFYIKKAGKRKKGGSKNDKAQF